MRTPRTAGHTRDDVRTVAENLERPHDGMMIGRCDLGGDRDAPSRGRQVVRQRDANSSDGVDHALHRRVVLIPLWRLDEDDGRLGGLADDGHHVIGGCTTMTAMTATRPTYSAQGHEIARCAASDLRGEFCTGDDGVGHHAHTRSGSQMGSTTVTLVPSS